MNRTKIIGMIAGLLVLGIGGLAIAALSGGTTTFPGFIRVCDYSDGACPTGATATSDGDLIVEDALEVDGATDLDGALNAAGATTLQGTLGVTGALTASSTLDVTGITTLSAGVDAPTLASTPVTIRFCGNGPNGATATYVSPVLLDDTEADLAFGGAGCDGEDTETEADADEPWHAGFAFKPTGMACVGLCTGATAADDAIVFQLRDDTADVTGMTCTTAALGGDATPAQCSVTDTTPATVAAASAIAIEITMTDDDCNDAGDDFECLLTAVIQ